jgi:hypothetical protein
LKTKNYDKIGEFQFLTDNKAKCSFLFRDSYLEEIPPIQAESLKEKEPGKKENVPEHIIAKEYRTLSAAVLWHGPIPIDFSDAEVLKAAAPLVEGQPLFKDHIYLTDYNIGTIHSSKFDESTKPSGINSNFWIDNRLDEKTAIRVQEGYLKCCSVTVRYRWKKSHEKMSDKEFFQKLGQTHSGHLVRLIVTKILEIPEVSVVWLGADRTARALSETQTNQNIKNPVQQQDKEVKTAMDEETKRLLSQLSGKEISTLSTDAGIQAALDALNEKVKSLETDNTTLKGKVDSLQEWKTGVIDGLKSNVETLMKLVDGIDQEGQKVLPEMNKTALDNADYDALVKMKKDYESKKTAMFPPTCQACGAKVTEIRSSVDEELPGDEPQNTENSIKPWHWTKSK